MGLSGQLCLLRMHRRKRGREIEVYAARTLREVLDHLQTLEVVLLQA